MLVGETQRVAQPGARRRRRAWAQGAQHAVQLAAAAPLPAVPEVGNPSIAAGPWPVDAARAKADAQRVLNSIDFSKRDIVLWVPGTSNHHVPDRLAAAVHAAWKDGGASLTHVEYPATWDMRPSVATGVATMKLVLAGIAAQGGNHRVLVAGESQGAWVLGEALADPLLGRVVDRAVLFGHPGLAKTHYEGGRDPRVLEVNAEGDHVAAPVQGEAAKALDASVAINQKRLWKLGTIGDALAANLAIMPDMIRNGLGQTSLLRGVLRNAHDYTGRMTDAVEFLRAAPLRDAAAGAGSLSAAVQPAALQRARRARRRANRP